MQFAYAPSFLQHSLRTCAEHACEILGIVAAGACKYCKRCSSLVMAVPRPAFLERLILAHDWYSRTTSPALARAVLVRPEIRRRHERLYLASFPGMGCTSASVRDAQSTTSHVTRGATPVTCCTNTNDSSSLSSRIANTSRPFIERRLTLTLDGSCPPLREVGIAFILSYNEFSRATSEDRTRDLCMEPRARIELAT
jgi:hypothetical protein